MCIYIYIYIDIYKVFFIINLLVVVVNYLLTVNVINTLSDGSCQTNSAELLVSQNKTFCKWFFSFFYFLLYVSTSSLVYLSVLR